ncbi:MAG: post-transcriptional regulator [bacterium]|nr:post-transcriptional regulator [bacterium]
MEVSSLSELYNSLRPAFKVKLRLLREKNINYIKQEDIWQYLYETKWLNIRRLTISEIVSSILHCDEMQIDLFLKEKLMNNERNLYFRGKRE